MRQAIKNNLLSFHWKTHSRCHPLSQLNLRRRLLSWVMLPEPQWWWSLVMKLLLSVSSSLVATSLQKQADYRTMAVRMKYIFVKITTTFICSSVT